MTTIIVGVFDDSKALERAIERLAQEGFRDTVLDEAMLSQELGTGGFSVPLPGTPGPGALGVVAGTTGPDRLATVKAFKERLEGDFHLPHGVVESYANMFYHEGKFVIVEVKKDRAPQVMDILRACNASQVNRHG